MTDKVQEKVQKVMPLCILILCTGNSCRSIMAEALFNHLGNGRVEAYSAGSNPVGYVHPLSLKTLEKNKILTHNPHSKSWDTFKDLSLDITITVCDSAAGEQCPVFIGSPLKAHWGLPDPAKAEGRASVVELVFQEVFEALQRKVVAFLEAPIEQLSKEELQSLLLSCSSMK